MGAFFILYNLSMFISRFARTITSFPHFKCREMALFHIVCYFKLFSLSSILFFSADVLHYISFFCKNLLNVLRLQCRCWAIWRCDLPAAKALRMYSSLP